MIATNCKVLPANRQYLAAFASLLLLVNKLNLLHIMKKKIRTILTGIICAGFLLSCQVNSPGDYKGKTFSDLMYKEGPQSIPGKLQCEYYDFGGEDVAYHDDDTINSGSGRLNPADGSYLHEFRINEAVDISFTKFRDPAIDNNQFNFVEPEKDQLYVGWTAPGEWTKYTVKVKKAGTYQLGIMYTANQNGKISFSVNDKDATGPVLIPSTFVEADSVAWRQWHHWNYIDDIARLDLQKGLHTITIHTVDIGQMNYDYINFEFLK
jgi:hypothetical protein